MNVPVTAPALKEKTMADIAQHTYEPALEQLEQTIGSNGRGWFGPTRKAALARFGQLGFPTTRHEEWCYTNLASLAKAEFAIPASPAAVSAERLAEVGLDDTWRLVFVNGHFSADLSDCKDLPAGLRLTSLGAALQDDRATLEGHLARHASFDADAFTALNTALLTDGAFIHVERNTVVDKTIQLIFVSTGADAPLMSHVRNVVITEDSSQLRMVETFLGLEDSEHLTTTVTEVVVGANATFEHYKLGCESLKTFHIGNLHINQAADSTVTSHTFNFGGRLVRNDFNANLDGTGCHCTLNGLSMVNGTQHVDNHLNIEHAHPHCNSWEYFKGIYNDQARGVFSGRIHVHEDAQKTDAKQTNMSLLLSDQALADSKPQLEIFADDVKCTHGATIGQLDDEALFYLKARCLNADAARSLLVYAFAGEVIDLIGIDQLKDQVRNLVLDRLPQGEMVREAL